MHNNYHLWHTLVWCISLLLHYSSLVFILLPILLQKFPFQVTLVSFIFSKKRISSIRTSFSRASLKCIEISKILAIDSFKIVSNKKRISGIVSPILPWRKEVEWNWNSIWINYGSGLQETYFIELLKVLFRLTGTLMAGFPSPYTFLHKENLIRTKPGNIFVP